MNDGICVPVVVILLGLAIGTQIERHSMFHVAWVVIEEIGIGLLVGTALTAASVGLLRWTTSRGWLSETSNEVFSVALAGGCFAAAQALGGSGFIACFSGGLLLGRITSAEKHALLRGVEATGDVLALLTWLAFGAAGVSQFAGQVSGRMVVYAILSLTAVRMLPVAVCLLGTGLGIARTLFIGWFGPRGLASIVFAVMVLDAHLPGNETLMATVMCTVLFSVLAHGHTANPLTRLLARRPSALPEEPARQSVP